MLTDDPGATGVLLNAGPGERGGAGRGAGAAPAIQVNKISAVYVAREITRLRPANARNRCGRVGIGLTQPQAAVLVVNDQPGRAPSVPGQRLGAAAGPGAVATSSAHASNCCWVSSSWATAVFSSC